MQINAALRRPAAFTHEGAPAVAIGPEQELRRTVMAAMLWEENFYESGESVAARVRRLMPLVRPEFAAACAAHAREKMKLRHMPLLIVREMLRAGPRHKALVGRLLADVIMRPDEITEFLAIYWATEPARGRKGAPVPKQVKTALARAFRKFSEYQFAKYDRDKAVKLRDALFLCHAKPANEEQAALFKKIAERTLTPPDTWEVALSAGADKRSTFERLMAEQRLGALAFLRNLRNMAEVGVERAIVAAYGETVGLERVLPFRFIAAARAVPQWEDIIEPMMLHCVAGQPKLPGHTVLMVDVSGSMGDPISAKSDLRRIDAACGLAILLREICESVAVYTFSNALVHVPPRRGFALRDAIHQSQPHSGTYLGQALVSMRERHDRLIVITDEQSADRIPPPPARGYVVNVAAYQAGVGYGPWLHIDGWSEAIVDYLREYEAPSAQ